MSAAHPSVRVPLAAPAVPVHRVVPGDWWVGCGERSLRVQTLLGSCVSLVLWHPGQRVGGLCHYLLPQRVFEQGPLSGRYGDEAVELMVQALREHTQAPLSTFQAYLYGGADAFRLGPQATLAIGHRNVELGESLVARLGLVLADRDTLDSVPRVVELDTATGRVSCRRGMAL